MRSMKPILLVEDSCLDTLMVERAIKELNIGNALVKTTDGRKAVQYLREQDNEKPCLIITDLDTPNMNGIEFLSVLKADDSLRKIPVMMLTSSNDSRDVIDSFDRGACGYMVKPADYTELVEMLKTIDSYWSLSELPVSG